MNDFDLKGGITFDEDIQESDSFFTVSGGDVCALSDPPDFGDLDSVLDHIDFVAGGIFFLIAFIWVEGKVARVARRFTGNE